VIHPQSARRKVISYDLLELIITNCDHDWIETRSGRTTISEASNNS
jgi:hypothetical protein